MNLTDELVKVALLGAEWVLWLLVALSVLSVAVMVERALFYWRRRVDIGALRKASILAIREDTAMGLRERFGTSEAMAARVAVVGLAQRDRGIASVAEAMTSEKTAAKNDYDSHLVVLGTLGNNAPFIGLFGTVLGIVRAFHDLKSNPEGGVDVVMGSVSEALVATAVGILVAIPAVVAYNLFHRRLRAALTDSDAIAHALLAELHAQAGTPAKAPESES